MLHKSPTPPPLSTGALRRQLGFLDGVCVIVSIMIGSGIFASPGVALERSGSPGASLIAWCVAGGVVVIAALCYAELGAMMPTAGGDYEYLKRAYGEWASFSFGWYFFWIAKPGSQAIIATVFGNYTVRVFTGLDGDNASAWASKVASVGLILALTGLNCMGVRESSWAINALTVCKIALILCVFVAGMVYLGSDTSTLKDNLYPSEAFTGTHPVGLGTAIVACLWAYDGWADLSFLAEELRDFEKRLPLAIITGVAGCYVMANIAYLSVLSKDDIKDSDAVAIDLGRDAAGGGLAAVFAAGVALSAAGAANGSILTGGRAFYAIARAGQAPGWLSRLNSAGAPWTSLLAQASWAITLLLLPGSSYSTLLDYAGPAEWLFYAFTGSAVIVLRNREPDCPRPYRVPMYPLPPILLVLTAACLVGNSLYQAPLFCFLALSFIALSLPAKWVSDWCGRCHKRTEVTDTETGASEPLLVNDTNSDVS